MSAARAEAEAAYRQIYEHHAPLMRFLASMGTPVPREFQIAAEFAINTELRRLIEAQWAVCEKFGVSIGFHSGSGKSAENYRVMGDVTGGRLEQHRFAAGAAAAGTAPGPGCTTVASGISA